MPEQTFTDQNFATEVLNSEQPVLVDFWAPWCGPCKLQGPIVEELSNEFSGKGVKVGKLNVDENPETAQNHQILSIPTLLIFQGGRVVDKLVGLQNKDVLVERLGRLVK